MRVFSVCILLLAHYFASHVQSYAITGVQGSVNGFTGERPVRQEFSTFKNSGPAFDLYILALQQFQQQNQSALVSFFQVAGKSLNPSMMEDNTHCQARYTWISVRCMGRC